MKRLGENLRLRVLSLFIAILLWIYVINIQNPEIKRDIEDVPIQIVNVDVLASYGLILDDHEDMTTTVKIKGKQEAVKKLSKNDIKAFVDLKDCTVAGRISFPIEYSMAGVQGVKAEGLPDKIDLQIEKYTQAQKAVDIVMLGNNNKQAMYEVQSVKPNMVTISGPESLIKNIHSVKVFVDVTNQQKDISVVKKYKVFNSRGSDVTDSRALVKDNQSIQVDINYYKAKEVPVLLNISGQVAEGYYIAQTKVEPEKIVVFGQADKVDMINNISTSELNILNAAKGLSKELKLMSPKTLKTNYNGVIKASLDIQKEQLKTIDLNNADINMLNPSDKYEYKILTSKIQINLAGRYGALDSLSIAELYPTVDVQGLGPGDYRMKVRVNTSDRIKAAGDNPVVKLKISEK
jgi:YbbR domain-containing protein